MCSHVTWSSLWLHQLPWVPVGTSANYWSVLVWGGRWLPVFFQRQSNSMNAAHLWVKYNLSLCAGSIHCSRWNGQFSGEMCAVPSWTHPMSWNISLPDVCNSIPLWEEHCSKRTWWDGGRWWKTTSTEQLLCTHTGKCLHQLVYPSATLRGREELQMSQMALLQLDQDHSLTQLWSRWREEEKKLFWCSLCVLSVHVCDLKSSKPLVLLFPFCRRASWGFRKLLICVLYYLCELLCCKHLCCQHFCHQHFHCITNWL